MIEPKEEILKSYQQNTSRIIKRTEFNDRKQSTKIIMITVYYFIRGKKIPVQVDEGMTLMEAARDLDPINQ